MYRNIVVGKQGAQCLARTTDTAHHRSTRDTQHRGGFLIAEAADIDDRQNVAMVNAQLFEGLPDGKLVDDHGFERNRHEARSERILVKRVDVRLPAFGAQPVDPVVAHDGEHPGPERALAVRLRGTGDGANDGVLIEIGRRVHVVSQRSGIAIQTPRYRAQAVVETLPTLHGHRDA